MPKVLLSGLLSAQLLLAGPVLAQPRTAALRALLQRHRVPGMQLVYTHGDTVEAYAVGVRDVGTGWPVTAATTFEAASLGKAMLAYVALRLHDQGQLDLDRPLLRYYADPRARGQPRAARVTARMVLAHTAGLPNWVENPTRPGWKTAPLTWEYAPDSCWNYSGEGYAWLQRTLEHLTGKPWRVLARQQVFGPLGLAHSSFAWQPAFAATASAGHDAQGRPVPIDHFADPNAGYSLYATAGDYSRFLRALSTGRGLRPATARLLQVPASPANRCGRASTAADAHIDWACGVGLAATSRGLAQWQWGDNTTFKGFYLALPGRRATLVYFTNSAHGDELAAELLPLFFGPGQYWAPQWLATE